VLIALPLYQRVQGSKPCAPAIEIEDPAISRRPRHLAPDSSCFRRPAICLPVCRYLRKTSTVAQTASLGSAMNAASTRGRANHLMVRAATGCASNPKKPTPNPMTRSSSAS
jgi:hypothetical protein